MDDNGTDADVDLGTRTVRVCGRRLGALLQGGLLNAQEPEPKQVLQQMRLQRAQMIQKPEQYAFSNYASFKWYERNGHLYT